MRDVEAVIILGKKEDDKDPENNELRGRVEVGVDIFIKYQAEYLILTGGKTSSSIPECYVMAEYATNLGVDSKNVLKECYSLDTIGNGYFTRRLIDSLKNVTSVYVVSSCYHMPRVKFIFQYCYGNKYLMNFDNCYPFKSSENHEIESLKMAEQLFVNIIPGDIDAIWKKMTINHSLYR